jgi:23S rRNA-/tRNA-specific pseudouridylate synthase
MVTSVGQLDGQKFSLLQCIPKTGRTHQIRVHLAYAKHPIISDVLYGPKNGLAEDKGICERMALHAWRLSFIDNKGVEQAFTTPPPEDFKKALAALDIQELSW